MRPLILVSPCTDQKGAEFADASVSLSNRYSDAILQSGGLPLIVPITGSKQQVAEYVSRCDGVLLTGGEDVQPQIYAPEMPEELAAKAAPIEPERDVLELLLISEAFRQKKAILAICRGHQILNVALGGTLFVDIPTQCQGTIQHRCMDRKNEPVHSVQLTTESDLSKWLGCRTIDVNSTHHQAVADVAPLLSAVGRAEDGIVEVMELKDKTMLPFLLSVQFHPERLIDRHTEFVKLFKRFVQACGKASQD